MKKTLKKDKPIQTTHGVINGAGEVTEDGITDILEKNYMPYAMSVIMSRAIPEIDGFKPSHRKLLFTMYKMNLLNSSRTKSANIVGQTMKLNPHGDSAIYDTMVRLSRGYEALLHPYIDSKGNFGKFYSRDMAWAASRYTEAKLDSICNELFEDIDKDTVDFIDNYDNTLKEPTLLPTKYPSILVNANTGIAVGMASSICSFNLSEVCKTTIELIKNENHDVTYTLLAPDFPGGGQILYNKHEIKDIYKTGRGSIKVRAEYKFDKDLNCIDIFSIPPTTTCEAIIEKVIDLVKNGKVKEISDIRDETGINGLKITIDLKRGIDPDKLMIKLYRFTTLEDSFSCNFNILISSTPMVMGIKEILEKWIAFRQGCIKRRVSFDLRKKSDRLHLLRGLEKILADIDKAIAVIRNTEEDLDVLPNLMINFGIDKKQAEYVSEIKLRNLNKEYILNRIRDISVLEKDIKELNEILNDESKVNDIIIEELEKISEKYGMSRKSKIIYHDEVEVFEEDQEILDYPVTFFFTRDGYFKKITPQSLRMSKEQKIKEDDEIVKVIEGSNKFDLLFFTNKAQVYKSRAFDFQDTKASVLGDFVPAKLAMDEDEDIIYMVATDNYKGFLLFCFENGKVAKVGLESYYTKTNRKKLANAYNDKSVVTDILFCNEDKEIEFKSSDGHIIIIYSGILQVKSTRSTQGVAVMNLCKGQRLISASEYEKGSREDESRYMLKNIPAVGSIPKKQ